MGNASNIFKAFARVLKKSEKQLLLSTTYALNSSSTKKITIGLGLRNDDQFTAKISIPESDDGHEEEYCTVERLGLIWGACATIGCILLICILPYYINSTFRPPVVL